MANYYSDGKSAKFIEIPINFGADAIDAKFEGQVLHWKFDDLRLVDNYHRRSSNVNDEAVSYTHLDVYKRQAQLLACWCF